MPAFDLFLSYRTALAPRVAPLVRSLEAAGVRVWQDTAQIRAADSITEALRGALASSRALAVYASPGYQDSLVCAWELASAWIAAERDGAANNRVIFLKPPELSDLSTVALGPLGDCLAFELPAAPADLGPIAADIARHLDSLDARTLGDLVVDLTGPAHHYPHPRSGSNLFVGRSADLWHLHGLLQRARHVGVTGHVGQDIAQVRGLGGIGKTLLAIEYARRFDAAWPGGIFWIDADPTWAILPPGPSAASERRISFLASLAGHLRVSPVAGDLAATAHAVERALEQATTGRPYLWILDNLPHGATQPAFDALLPPTDQGALLLTTRSLALGRLGALLDLDVLPPDAALALLTDAQAPDSDGERAAAHDLIALLGHHPLALDVLRALIPSTLGTTPYVTWRARITDPASDHLDERALALVEQLPTGAETSIPRLLSRSLDGRSAPARDILRLASVLALAPIPLDLVGSVISQVGQHSDTQIEQALDELVKHALLRLDREQQTIDIHAIVRRVVYHGRLSTEAASALAETSRVILANRFQSVEDVRRHGPLLKLEPHAAALIRAETDASAWLSMEFGEFYRVRGDYPRAQDLLERACALCLDRFGADSPQTLAAQENLARILNARGDYQRARAYHERVLEVLEKSTESNTAYRLIVLGNLANTLQALGDLAGAKLRQEQALAAWEAGFGRDHENTLYTLQNLATTLKEMGRFDEAHRYLDEALKGLEHIFGPEHPATLRARLSMVATTMDRGDIHGALTLCEQVLVHTEANSGVDHPDTLQVRHRLALILKAAGDLQRARAEEEHVLAVQERVLGSEHPQTLSTVQNLAVTCRQQGDHPTALLHLNRALEVQRRTLGPEHPFTLTALQNLAVFTHDAGDLSGAFQLSSDALAARERILGSEHPDTLMTLANLGVVLQDMNDLAGARALLERALASNEHVLGPHHRQTLSCIVNLSRCMEDHESARALLERALASQIQTLGPDHPYTNIIRFNLGILLRRLGLPEAESHLRHLYPLLDRPVDQLSPSERTIVEALSWLPPLPTPAPDNPLWFDWLESPPYPVTPLTPATSGGRSHRRRRRPHRPG